MKRKINGIHIIAMALLMTLIMASSAFATSSWTYQDRISVQTGEPLYISWSSSDSTAGTLTAVNSSYYPADFVLWVGDGSAPTVSNGTATFQYETQTTLEDNTTVVTNRAYQIHLNGSGNIKVTLDETTEYTITNSAPTGTAPSAGNPTAFNGYLPLGQFASGAGWGSIHSNGTNLTGSTKKFLSGYNSTGISLGAAGGFTDYTFYANNASTHPYGVDFIVYGNAFSGNPEAGAVKVYGFTSADDTTGEWYDLAGSMYYDGSASTKNNKDVYWKLVVSTDSDAKGIWYQVVNAGGSTSSSGWTRFNSAYTWWPFANKDGISEDVKGYKTINGMTTGSAFNTSDATVNSARTQIRFKNVNLVKDTDNTNDYQFGYFDIHANGSSYGTAINPYTATASTQGGDGFDLSWAVKSNGEPIALDHITKVRLYTCAAMNSDGTAFTTPSIFGETSAEVCGIYSVNGSSSDGTKSVTVTCNGNSYTPSHLSYQTIPVSAGTVNLTFTSSASTIMVNGVSVSSGSSIPFTIASGATKYVQVITQDGTGSPLVTGVKLTA